MTGAGETEVETTPQATTERAVSSRVVSIREALNGSKNSLGIIRLVLASLVIVDHAFILGGFGFNPIHGITQGQASLGSLAVGGFFAISGYLIVKSGMSGDVLQFMWRRTLRIFPAYWLVLLVTAFAAAPLVWVTTGRDLGSLFSEAQGPLSYLRSNWTLHLGQQEIAGLLLDTPYGEISGAGTFNGSLWTLIHEWTCYLIVAILMAFGVLRHARIVVPLLAAYFFAMQLLMGAGVSALAVMPSFSSPAFVSLALAFFSAGALAVYSALVPFDDRLGVLAGLVLIFSLRYGGFSTVGIVAGAYFVLYLGARLPRQLHWIGAKNDYSYGVYIYGFLVQQIGAHLGWHELGYLPYVVIAWTVAFGFAWLSWHGVEKRAMSLKSWGPGRGWHYWVSRVTSKSA